MPKPIQILVGDKHFEAELDDTACAQSIAEAMPIQGIANIWGDEIYFDIGLDSALDDTARATVSLGDIGFWPSGQAICLFYGPTPISGPDEIRPASAVNIVGRILSPLEPLKQSRDGDPVVIQSRDQGAPGSAHA